MASSNRHPFFVTCGPGLEALLHAELRALRLPRLERQVGGVRFEGTLEDAWRANLWTRSGIRVLLQLARFEARDDEALYRQVGALDWSRFITAGQTLQVDARSRDSELHHTRFVEQRVKDAIVDQFRSRVGARPSVAKEGADLKVHVYVLKNRVTLSADTSGESLHKRGWRRYQGWAPLSETLAASMVLLSGWDGRAPLLDPFCGSGTILIEGAFIAARRAPGLFRKSFGFERWTGHDAKGFERMKDAARKEERPLSKRVKILGQDIDPGHLDGALANLEAAGLADHVTLETGDARRLTPRKGWNAWIVTNPPYGERVGEEKDLRGLYRSFGARLREHCSGFHLSLLCGNPSLLAAIAAGPEASSRDLLNGGIECRLLQWDVP